jgi:hypothetical protein
MLRQKLIQKGMELAVVLDPLAPAALAEPPAASKLPVQPTRER